MPCSGQIAPKNLFDLRPDLRTLMLLARLKERNAESLFGGIGEELYLSVRQFSYPDISAIVLLLLLTVAAIDLLCGRLRARVIGAEDLRAR